MGLSLSCGLRDPLVFFMELAEFNRGLVRREPQDIIIWLACGLRFGASRSGARSSVDGGCAVHSRAGHCCDMDISGGGDVVCREIEEKRGGRRRESDERELGLCLKFFLKKETLWLFSVLSFLTSSSSTLSSYSSRFNLAELS